MTTICTRALDDNASVKVWSNFLEKCRSYTQKKLFMPACPSVVYPNLVTRFYLWKTWLKSRAHRSSHTKINTILQIFYFVTRIPEHINLQSTLSIMYCFQLKRYLKETAHFLQTVASQDFVFGQESYVTRKTVLENWVFSGSSENEGHRR